MSEVEEGGDGREGRLVLDATVSNLEHVFLHVPDLLASVSLFLKHPASTVTNRDVNPVDVLEMAVRYRKGLEAAHQCRGNRVAVVGVEKVDVFESHCRVP